MWVYGESTALVSWIRHVGTCSFVLLLSCTGKYRYRLEAQRRSHGWALFAAFCTQLCLKHPTQRYRWNRKLVFDRAPTFPFHYFALGAFRTSWAAVLSRNTQRGVPPVGPLSVRAKQRLPTASGPRRVNTAKTNKHQKQSLHIDYGRGTSTVLAARAPSH